jgi:iron complex transport system permease protein
MGVALVLLLAACGLGVALGPVSLPLRGVVLEFVDRLPWVDVESGFDARQSAVLWQLRVPRVVLAGLVGGTLSIAGGAYQGVFRNPLADPYLLGVAAGAGLGATMAIIAGFGGLVLPVAAFAGGLGAVLMTYALGRAGGPSRSTGSLILAGVAVASFFTALQTFAQQRATDTIREVFAWILGRLTTVGWDEVLVLVPFTALAIGVILAHRRHLDVLAVGESEASTLGMNTGRVRLTVVVAATLGTAAAVSVSGLIGFVGIIVPHTVRLLTGWSYRVVLPLSFVGGAAFLVLADVAARTVIAPSELPIGIITAFFGAPFFIVVLRRSIGKIT